MITVLGLAFKPGTDDIRFSVALDFMQYFLDRGATVRGFDPVAMENSRKEVPGAEYPVDIASAVQGAHAVVLATEWNEFRRLDLSTLKTSMAGNLIVDLKNIYDPAAVSESGLRLIGVGRGHLK